MKLICDICEKNFSNIGNLNKHKKQVHDIKTSINYCKCGKYFENSQAKNAHNRWCLIHRDGEEVAPSGFKGKNSSFKGKKYEEFLLDADKTKQKLRERRLGKTYSFTDEQKRKCSLARINYLENNSPHVKWFEVNGIKVQGNWERLVAETLVELGIIFSRVKLNYDVYRTYTPDFFLNDFNIYIEVKGWMKDRDIEKYSKVLNEHNIDLRILQGKETLKQFVNKKINIFDLPKFTPP